MEYLPYKGEQLKNVQYFSKRILSLPLHLWMTKDDVGFIVSKLLEVAK